MSKEEYQSNPKTRFSSRVENYIKYRPNYPPEIIDFLREKAILKNNSIIADVGSGTGILSELFLKNGNKVFGIEPNADMRKAGGKLMLNYPKFISIDGSAESTSLNKNSVDLITAGQAFHWFNVEETRREFKRILKPSGCVVLIRNNRRKSGTNFSSEYEEFVLQYGTDYKLVRKNEGNVHRFLNYQKKLFFNYQELDYEGLKGRLLSTSYIPLESNPKYKEMINQLEELFNKHQYNNLIKLEYDTEIYYGQLD